MLVQGFHSRYHDYTHPALPPITGVEVDDADAVYVKVELERKDEQKEAGLEKDSNAS